MKHARIIFILLFVTTIGCEDLLDVPNPNKPTPASAANEDGMIALAQGGLYVNGLQGFFGGVINEYERIGDIVTTALVPVEAYTPLNIELDNGKNLPTPFAGGQMAYLRATNIPGVGNRIFTLEWSRMYALIGAMNAVQTTLQEVEMMEAKKKTLLAWIHFWKGFAYSRIGSIYYSGIINDEFNSVNSMYVMSDEILLEAERNFAQAETYLTTLSGDGYTEVINALIPSLCKVGKGLPLSANEWIRNINTMRARNILVNTTVSQLTTAQWDEIITLTNAGVRSSDRTFTARADAFAGILGPNGSVASGTIGPASEGGGGNKISERFIQEFKAGDNRLTNNFNLVSAWIGSPNRGTLFNTRYLIVDKGKGMAGVFVYANRTAGAYEYYIAGTYEENILMQAEANIYKGNIDAGLTLIDELRDYQGAGLAPVANIGLSSDQAKEELRRERRVALAFRGFSFYDARRWGVLENGRTGAVVVDFDGTVNTNAKIDYGYLDYWDVPISELFYNPPAEGSAPVVNPKQ